MRLWISAHKFRNWESLRNIMHLFTFPRKIIERVCRTGEACFFADRMEPCDKVVLIHSILKDTFFSSFDTVTGGHVKTGLHGRPFPQKGGSRQLRELVSSFLMMVKTASFVALRVLPAGIFNNERNPRVLFTIRFPTGCCLARDT